MEPNLKKDVKFQKVHYKGKDHYKLDDPEILLTWSGGGKTEIEFDYPGKKGFMLIPFPHLFEAVDGDDQIFELHKGKPLTLVLRPKSEVAKHYPVNGTLQFSYAIFDEHFKNYAIGNSPPDMMLGP